MKCKNCGMGFVLNEYNPSKKCPHCGHVHGEDYVEHTHEDGVTHAHENGNVPHEHNEENNMIKKIWKFICWPFVSVLEWLKSCLPKGK